MRLRVTLLVMLAAAPAAAASPRGEALRRDVEGYAIAACLTRQEPEFLRRQGHLWAAAIMERRGGDLDHWQRLSAAVEAEAARRPMAMARGDGPVDAPLLPMPVFFCHEVIAATPVRAAIAQAMRRLARDRPRR